MSTLITNFAASVPLYTVNIDVALLIPLAYIISLSISILLREFTHGWIRYVLAALFLGSFAALWFILELDSPPFNFVMAITVLFGGVSGLSTWLREIFKEIKKIT